MTQYDLVREQTLSDKAIITALFMVCIVFIVFFVYGIFACFWSVPAKRAEIWHFQNQAEIWQARARELEAAVKNYQTAMKFEGLFLMVADPNAIMNFEAVEELIQDKKEFYEDQK